MRAFITAVMVFVNFILQTTLFQHVAIMGVTPNTAILLVVSLAILRDDVEGAAAGFFAGLLVDILYAPFIGLNALLYMLVGFFCAKPFRDFFEDNVVIPVILAFVSVMAYEFLYFACNFLLQGYADIGLYFRGIILPSAAYSAVLALPVFLLVRAIHGRLDEKEKPHRSLFRR